jgi:short-subunit dehydrogenase
MRVAIGDLDAELAREAAAELGDGAVGLELDVTRRDSFAAFLDEAETRLGELDVLVNNAGIMVLGRFADEDDASTRRMVDINVHGVLLGMKLALPRMTVRDRGHIVNMASQAGAFGAPGGATYSATKHAVVGATEAIRGELRHEGSRVGVSYVLPYIADTELGRGTTTVARTFRVLRPEEIADAIVAAVRDGTVDVWLPRHSRLVNRVALLVPRPLREAATRVLKADRVLAAPDAAARRAYEDRVKTASSLARSSQGDEPGASRS